jgi:cytoskeletal protein CcmA (bactofilin family)
MSPTLAIVILCTVVTLWAALPLLPALIELYRRQDVVPFAVPPVQERDVRRFAWVFRDYVQRQLALMNQASAVKREDRRARFPDGTTVHIVNEMTSYVPDIADRRKAPTGERVVVSTGPLAVPHGAKELGHVYASNELVGGSTCVYRSVFCEGDVELGERSVVLRWIHAEGALHAHGGSQLLGRTTAKLKLQLDEGCCFERLYAPRILFGEVVAAGVPDVCPPDEHQDSTGSGAALQRVEGDYTIPAHTRIAGDLIVHGNVTVGDCCLLLGSLKARKHAEIGRGTRVNGNIIAVGNLYVGPDCIVQGVIVGERDIFIDQRARIGSEAVPTTVTAERIYVGSGVVSHGVVWPRRRGFVAKF